MEDEKRIMGMKPRTFWLALAGVGILGGAALAWPEGGWGGGATPKPSGGGTTPSTGGGSTTLPPVSSILTDTQVLEAVAWAKNLPLPVATVKGVQQALNQIAKTGLVVDGIYGPATAKAVASFQKSKSLTVDGKAGTQTQAALKSAGATALGSLGCPGKPACGCGSDLKGVPLRPGATETGRWVVHLQQNQ